MKRIDYLKIYKYLIKKKMGFCYLMDGTFISLDQCKLQIDPKKWKV